MTKTIANNKVLFYMVVAVTALFLAITVMPRVNAAAPGGDTIAPDDVENVQIEVYDGAALLTWDVAMDNVAVKGYKIYSGPSAVTPLEGEYSNPVIDAGDQIKYLVTGLENGTKIYFAVTAYDAEGNESESYSNEVYGTPDATYGSAPAEYLHTASDEESPTVADAEALDKETVKVVFSEAVVVPATSPETAFTIMNNATSETLAVKSVKADEEDILGKTVLLTTDPQEGGAEYILTAGIQIEDTGGNPIISGTSDTAAFIGSTVEPGSDLTGDLPEDDTTAPTLTSAESLGATTVKVTFSEPIILDSDPVTNFEILEENDPVSMLEIMGVEKNAEGSVVTLETSEQKSVSYTITVTGVLDEAGNEIDINENSVNFEGNLQEEVTPPEGLTPENVKNFVANIVRELVIKLSWDKPEDVSIVDQVLYKSTDGGKKYDNGTPLGADREEVELTGLTPGQEYYFKLTTKNEEGVESEGMITHIMLPETGPGLLLLVGASMGFAAFKNRKKK
jgi:hypothetical protein